MGENYKIVVEKSDYLEIDPILENNSWATIKKAIYANSYPKEWLGQSKNITISSSVHSAKLVDIGARYGLSVNSTDTSKGVGRNRAVFLINYTINVARKMNNTSTNAGGFANSTMKKNDLIIIHNSIDRNDEVLNVIASVQIPTTIGGESSDISYSSCKLFIPHLGEMNAKKAGKVQAYSIVDPYSEGYNKEWNLIPFAGIDGTEMFWTKGEWTRSPYMKNSSYFVTYNYLTQEFFGSSASGTAYVSPCFAI